MGILDSIKNIFKSKEEVKPVAEEQKPISEKIEEPKVETEKRAVDKNCELCGGHIGQEKWTKQQGHWFHKKCFKDKKKEMIAGGLNLNV